MLWLDRDCKTFYGISIFRTTQKMTKVTEGYKVRCLINHFNQRFCNSVSNDDSESIDKHIVKFKGRSGMKQYIKNKPIKWDFKIWYRCTCETGYLCQLDLYLRKKESAEENLGPGVVLKMIESLQNSHCMVFFVDNFFNSPWLTVKLYERGLYGIGTAWKDRKRMPEMPFDRQIKRADFEYLYSDKIVCCKWLDRRSVAMLFSNAEGMATTSTVPL